MTSAVTAYPAATPDEALAHFSARLEFETDCWDVHDALSRDIADVVLLDVRDPALFAQNPVNGTVSLAAWDAVHCLLDWPALQRHQQRCGPSGLPGPTG